MTLDERIILAFAHLYPYIGPNYLTVDHREDETIVVNCSDEDVPSFRAVIHSDDDGYLRFTPFDEDDAPEDDNYDFLSIRVCISDVVQP